MNHLLERLRRFRDERDWAQFHSPKNLAVSVSIEAAELLELFQWSGDGNLQRGRNVEEVAAEAADVLIYTLMLLDRLGLDPEEEVIRKIEFNAKRYPAVRT